MIGCAHGLIEWEQHDEGMHSLGWVCRYCGYIVLGECHHETWCRADFCGAEPVVEEAVTTRSESVPR